MFGRVLDSGSCVLFWISLLPLVAACCDVGVVYRFVVAFVVVVVFWTCIYVEFCVRRLWMIGLFLVLRFGTLVVVYWFWCLSLGFTGFVELPVGLVLVSGMVSVVVFVVVLCLMKCCCGWFMV